jgi:hypothetical protein
MTTTFVWTGQPLLTRRRTSKSRRLEAENIQAVRQVSSKMVSRAVVCVVESVYHAKQGHKVHTFLHGAWLRSGPDN